MRTSRPLRLSNLIWSGTALLALTACGQEPDAPSENEAQAVTAPAQPAVQETAPADASLEPAPAETAIDWDAGRVLPIHGEDRPAASKATRQPSSGPAAGYSPPATGSTPPATPLPEPVDPHAGHDMQSMPDHDMSGMQEE